MSVLVPESSPAVMVVPAPEVPSPASSGDESLAERDELAASCSSVLPWLKKQGVLQDDAESDAAGDEPMDDLLSDDEAERAGVEDLLAVSLDYRTGKAAGSLRAAGQPNAEPPVVVHPASSPSRPVTVASAEEKPVPVGSASPVGARLASSSAFVITGSSSRGSYATPPRLEIQHPASGGGPRWASHYRVTPLLQATPLEPAARGQTPEVEAPNGDQVEVVSPPPTLKHIVETPAPRELRRSRGTKLQAQILSSGDKLNPLTMMPCQPFSQARMKQPFSVSLTTDVTLVMDMHRWVDRVLFLSWPGVRPPRVASVARGASRPARTAEERAQPDGGSVSPATVPQQAPSPGREQSLESC